MCSRRRGYGLPVRTRKRERVARVACRVRVCAAKNYQEHDVTLIVVTRICARVTQSVLNTPTVRNILRPMADERADEMVDERAEADSSYNDAQQRFMELLLLGKADAQKKRQAVAYGLPYIKWRPVSEYSCEQLEWLADRLEPGNGAAARPPRPSFNRFGRNAEDTSHSQKAIELLEMQLGDSEHDKELKRAISRWCAAVVDERSKQEERRTRCVALLSEQNDAECAICLQKLCEKPPTPHVNRDSAKPFAYMSPPCSPTQLFDMSKGPKVVYLTSCKHAYHRNCFCHWVDEQPVEVQNIEPLVVDSDGVVVDPAVADERTVSGDIFSRKLKVTLAPIRCCLCNATIADTTPDNQSGLETLFDLCSGSSAAAPSWSRGPTPDPT